MKLHQKLAVVLASTMAVTAVPVVTMAASTNSLTKETLKVKEDAEFVNYATANAVKIKFTDHIDGEEIFYLDLDNAKWDEDVLWDASQNEKNDFTAVDDNDQKVTDKDKVEAYIYQAEYTNDQLTDGIKYERQSDDTMKITVIGLATSGDPYVQIPLFAKAKDGDAKVSVVSKGGETTVSKGTFIFATTAEKKMSITAKNDKSFYRSGKLSDITIEESYKGSLENGGEFTIELDNSDYYFDSASFTLEGKYGFSKYGEQTYTGTITSKDDSTITIKLPSYVDAKLGDPATIGTWVIKDLKVKTNEKHPEEGDFLVDFKGDDLSSEKEDVKVAKVAENGVYVEMKDDKAEDVKAGRKEEVEFEIGENVEDSMITGRDFEMTLDNGYWDYKQLVKDAYDDNKLSSDDQTRYKNNYDKDWKDQDDEDDFYKELALSIDKQWLANKIMDNTSDWYVTGSDSDTTYCEAEFDQDNDDKAIPETILFTVGHAKKDGHKVDVQSNDDCDVLKFKTKICVPITNKDKDKVTIKVSGRAIENEASTTAINIINPFNVTYEQAVLKTGLQGQTAGSVTLKETDKDCFQKGDVVFKIKKDDEEFGIYLTDVDVEVSDGLKGTKSDIKKGKASGAKVTLTLNRASKSASTITFKDMKLTTDRTVPQGTYDLEIGGDAIDADGHTITIPDFIKISTTNTEDITASGLSKGTVKFVIGENKYTLNDKDVTMDAPSYIQDPGYTMVSARYLAQAFGVSEANILFKKGVVTIFAGERTINLTTGSNIAVVNGNQIPMATKVVNKNGRTYLPASQLANLLGIESSWDSATKTATFENK